MGNRIKIRFAFVFSVYKVFIMKRLSILILFLCIGLCAFSQITPKPESKPQLQQIPKAIDTLTIKTEYVLPKKEIFDLDNIITLAVGILGVFLGAFLTKEYQKNSLKKEYAYNMFTEINGVEMTKLRRDAYLIIKQHIDKNIEQLGTSVESKGDLSVYVILRFYQRLWFAIKYCRIDNKLAKNLFYDLFYYWHYVYFKDGVPDDWAAKTDLVELAGWFEKRLPEKIHQELTEKYAKKRDEIKSELSKPGNKTEKQLAEAT